MAKPRPWLEAATRATRFWSPVVMVWAVHRFLRSRL